MAGFIGSVWFAALVIARLAECWWLVWLLLAPIPLALVLLIGCEVYEPDGGAGVPGVLAPGPAAAGRRDRR